MVEAADDERPSGTPVPPDAAGERDLRPHLTVQSTLGSLDESDTSRIALDSEQLIQALQRAIPKARLRVGVAVTSVRIEDGLASVSWSQNTHQDRAPFDAVIIATPDADQLLPQRHRQQQQPSTHFHAYISVLLEFRSRWWSRTLPELRGGLYADGPLNFVEEVPTKTKGRHVLRIILPNAERRLAWDDAKIEAFSLRYLRKLSKHTENPLRCSIKRWPQGLPCGGTEIFYHQVTHRPPIYLAGDRSSKWPSMNGAIESGQRAAASLARAIGSARSSHVSRRSDSPAGRTPANFKPASRRSPSLTMA